MEAFETWFIDQLEENLPQKSYKLELRMLKDGSDQAGVFATEDIKVGHPFPFFSVIWI